MKVVKVKIRWMNLCIGVICLPTIVIASLSLKAKASFRLGKKNSGTARVFSVTKQKILTFRLRSSPQCYNK